MLKEDFVLKYSPLAIAAGSKYKINPKVVLATAALEGEWATSYSVKFRKNHYGMTAFGKPNPYWDGNKSESKTIKGLYFRVYKTELDSFMDFARLISEKYPLQAKASYDIKKYPNLIANSPYISEKNGDDRVKYEKALSSILAWMDKNLKESSPNKSSYFIESIILLFTSLALTKIF